MIPRPSVPAPYVAGKLELEPGKVHNLLELIQQKLAENCPGAATELKLWAAAGNTGSIVVGAASFIGGPLSLQNYAYKLTATSQPVTYRSTYPGNNTPIGELQVLAQSAAELHIEVIA